MAATGLTKEAGRPKLDCKDLHGYVKTLPPSVLDRLYDHPATCLAIFRELPELAKLYVMRILFVEQPITQTVMTAWVLNQYASEHGETVKKLADLHVLHEQTSTGRLPGWKLNDVFRKNLKIALIGGGTAWTGTGPLTHDKHTRDITFLNQYALERWEAVLHYMVRSKDCVSGVSREVVELLLHAGLIKTSESGDSEPYITPAGFQFLLLDTSSQIWYFMLQYLQTVETRGMDLVECLTFLFQLSFLTLGKDYSSDHMTDHQQRFLQHLREFGLVYQRKRKSQRFYPTRLAINLTSSIMKEGFVDSSSAGFIIAETNYRIYAYTGSSLQLALLALFCQMLYRFPNLAVCNITRDSVRAALSMGITADQIINYMKANAHPEMLKKKPVIPSTVTDQIRLWELERDRFLFAEGVLYSQFLSQRDFDLLRDHARDQSVLVWENPTKRVLVVTRNGHEDVKRFWKRHKQDSS